ncbi:hypothetical protein [Clostridium magnum]|uniref:HTH cro/C1-type domain-containing protein n=1 Tax=Clostridium magnum DSM 2767 TaxID=1121326 RepID=A0A161WXL6_9CLOT|nr:hypothetical protein [Clostridium magnum]KZL91758.1 hypothetical protein CLMAG_35170 [Clostridium magnum DSM 2767]SHJ02822.1 DNA-binding transcriptional regulator, XRE-family HTH domain [Clostridium magnum DSM 2767]
MEERKCKKCGEYMSYGLYDYYNEDWNGVSDIEKMAGYKCFNCNIVEFDEDIIENLDPDFKIMKMLYAKKRGAESPIQPIMISKVKNARMAKDIEPKVMADVLDFTEQRYGSLERNNNTPNVFLALQLEKIIGVDIHDLYEIVYIPTTLYNKLKILNDKFEVIEGIPELLDRNTEIDQEIKELKKDLTQRRAAIKRLVNEEISEEKKKNPKLSYTPKEVRDRQSDRIKDDEVNIRIMDTMVSLRAEKIDINEQIQNLTGNSKDPDKRGKKRPKEGEIERQDFLLRLGYCIDLENWERAKEIYADELDIENAKASDNDATAIDDENLDN